MFEPLPDKFDFAAAEREVLRFWKERDIFHQSLEQRRAQDAPRFVFYEGPPTANGLPHPGHCLTRAIKDLFPRYQTMCGRLVERKAGWDTHGLPVEVEVCKELGIHGKEEIEAYGLEPFVRKCVESVWKYVKQWEEMTHRLGFWVDLDKAYATYHQSYVESVWWGLKTLFERGLLYQGHKVVWWWAQGGTALSSGEVGEGYRTVDDPSVFVKFPLVEHRWAMSLRARFLEGEYNPTEPIARQVQDRGDEFARQLGAPISLLVWTTTPWTLVSNHFAAVHPDIEYALVHDPNTNESFVVARDLIETIQNKVKAEFVVLGTCMGADLVDLEYMPPFDCYAASKPDLGAPAHAYEPGDADKPLGQRRAWLSTGNSKPVGWRVTAADFVTIESGTGLVHEAPAYGEVDFELLQKERERFDHPDAIPLLNAVAPNGTFNDDAPERYRGRWVKDCDKDIIRELRDERKTPWGTPLLFHAEQYRHEYPFCPRAENDPLIQYARKSWFVRTSQFKDAFLANNATINWLPDHIREGRFGDFLRNNVDWALSRERYWGTPLPIWVCDQCGRMEANGSLAELQSRPGATDATPDFPDGFWAGKQAAATAEGKPLVEDLKVHRPYIDAWTYACGECEGAKRGAHGAGGSAGVSPARSAHESQGSAGVSPARSAHESQGSAGVSPARMRRVPEVIDCWWDAGSMPFAQWGYPHQAGSGDTFVDRFPADFISEAIDQTRGWFYGLLAINTLLFGQGSAGVSPAQRRDSDHTFLMQPVTAALAKRKRHKLPHWEGGGSTYFLTFRVAAGELSERERTVVLEACRHWDEDRLLLHAAVVMPDHVHLLLTPLERRSGEWWSLADLMHSIKGYTAKTINELRSATGQVWQAEFFDRIVRSESDFLEKHNYITTNPLNRGLPEAYEWVWTEPAAAGFAGRIAEEAGGRDARTPRPETGGRDARTPHPESRFPLPYRTCIVLGHMMGEDGTKMSKRLKNYREPTYVFDHLGADAMRWYFFSGQFPWTSVRFQEAAMRDAHRDFLVRLYNVFSFFNIYANIDGFAVAPDDHGGLTGTGHRATAERCELDRWILSELHLTTRVVRDALDRFENFPAAQGLKDFVDALSNWYVRRSRDRFWRSEKDADKWDAYNTLHEVLLTLSKLIAPFTPFFAETMYGNLQGAGHGARGGAPSVHLCDYPLPDDAVIDAALSDEMNIVREIASLGRAARTAAKLKVRQPLARVEIILARHEHEEWLRRHAGLIAEELNVHEVEFTADADHYVHYEVKPNFKAIGPKHGKLAPKIAGALKQLADPAEARRTLVDTGALAVTVDGQAVTLTPEELEIRLEAREGWSAAQGKAGVVVLSTELTEELKAEGLIREFIHHVQALRKQHNLAYEARITIQVETGPELGALIERFRDTVLGECLGVGIEPLGEAAGEALQVETHSIRLAIHPVATD